MTLTQKPEVYLGVSGDPFTLFYDYDQIEAHKLDRLTPNEKALWFQARLCMTYLEPLRRIWKDPNVFERLLGSKVKPSDVCSFSIAGMGIMLNVVEALGSFRNPDIKASKEKGENRLRFDEFLSNHMQEWNVNEPSSCVPVADVLWTSFRNGITHELRVDQVSALGGLWGSLEFQQHFQNTQQRRFERNGDLIRICPLDFFNDLDVGVTDYFSLLGKNNSVLIEKFRRRFDSVYPNKAA